MAVGGIRMRARAAGMRWAFVALLVVSAKPVAAMLMYGDVQISGNLETQNLVRFDNEPSLQPVQQRNTFHLQYEQKLVKRGKLLDTATTIPFVRDVDFFGYYRGV